MARYAEGTAVPVARSRDEVYRLLDRYGATEHLVGGDASRVVVGFRLTGRLIRVDRPLPRRASFPSQAGYDREIRRQWRVLVLVLKGRLELIDDGAETVDQAFAAYLALPDGTTAGDRIGAYVDRAYETGQMPDSLLPGLPPTPKVIALGAGRTG